MTGPNAHILFVVNTDMVEARSAKICCNGAELKIDPEKEYEVVELTTGAELGMIAGKDLVQKGFELEVPPNTCLLPMISAK